MRKLVILAMTFALVPGAMASFTTVLNTTYGPNELNPYEVFNLRFGLGLTGQLDNTNALAGSLGSVLDLNSVSQSFGGYTFTRLDDTDPNATDLLVPTPYGDSNWYDGNGTYYARARYAGYQQTLFIVQGATDTPILSINGTAYQYISGPPGNFTVNGNFLWGRGTTNAVATQHSNDPNDPLMTYLVTNNQLGYYAWWLFWEDGIDDDYNDLIVEISAVPVPAAALLGLIGMGLSFALRRKTT